MKRKYQKGSGLSVKGQSYKKTINRKKIRGEGGGGWTPNTGAINQYRTGGFIPAQQGVRGFGASETKTLDISETGSPLTAQTTTTNVTLLNGSQNGTGYWNRIGNKIHMKSLYFNAYMYATGTQTEYPDYIRVIIVYDRQTNAALPNWSDVILSITQANATSSISMDNINLTNKDRFSILMDERYMLPVCPTASAETQVAQNFNANCEHIMIKRYIKLGLETQYKASSGAIGDITTGGLFLMTQGLYASGSQGFALNFSSRVRFSDL